MSLKNLALDVKSIAIALSEEGGYEYYDIDDDLRELEKNVSDMQAENAKLRHLCSEMFRDFANCDYELRKHGRTFMAVTRYHDRLRELGVETPYE